VGLDGFEIGNGPPVYVTVGLAGETVPLAGEVAAKIAVENARTAKEKSAVKTRCLMPAIPP
jgi:hypothetical protein